MRAWGRTYDEFGNASWVEVSTAPNGSNEAVYATALVQCLKLNLGESPFWSQFGIPAQQSVMTQIYPDYYMQNIQQWFASKFAALTLVRQPTAPGATPTYNMAATFTTGGTMVVPIPT